MQEIAQLEFKSDFTPKMFFYNTTLLPRQNGRHIAF